MSDNKSDDKISDIERREMNDDIYALPKLKKVIPPPTNEEVLRMLQIARDCYGVVPGYGDKRWDLLKRLWWGRLMEMRILVFLVTFCRVSEACLLQRQDFDLERKFVQIYRAYITPKKRKGEISDPTLPKESPIKRPKRGSARIQPLGTVTCRILDQKFKELQLQPDDYILSGSANYVRPNVIRHFHKVIARAAGVDPQSVYPHVFRSKGATLLKAYGYGLAAQVLGHKDRGTTIMKSYDRPYESDKVKAVEEVTDSLVAGLKADMDREKEVEQEGDKGGHAAASEGGAPAADTKS